MKKILIIIVILYVGVFSGNYAFASVSGNDSKGYIIDNDTLELDGNQIITSALGADGLAVSGASVVRMTGGSISVNWQNSAGVLVRNGSSTVSLEGVSIFTDGITAFGLHSLQGTINMTGGKIITKNIVSYGAFASDEGVINLTNVVVESYHPAGTPDDAAYGLGAEVGGKIVMTGGSVYTEGQYSHGLASMAGKIYISDVEFIKTIANNTHGAYSYYYGSLIDIKNSNLITAGDAAWGVYSAGGGVLDMDGGAISTSGVRSHGAVVTENDSVMTLKNVAIETTGANAHGVYANYGGAMSLNGLEISVDAELGSYAVSALGGNGETALIYGEESVFNLNSSIVAGDYSSIDMTLGDGSLLTGHTSVGSTQSNLSLALNGSASLWNVTSDSTLTDLALSNAVINFGRAGLAAKITAENLNLGNDSAGGHLVMKTDIVNETADNLIVTGVSEGTHYISVNNVGTAETRGTEITSLVFTADQGSTFELLGGPVNLGAWKYSLGSDVYNTLGHEWFLYQSGPSDTGSGAINTFAGSYLLAYAETETLIQRLGDLRETPYLNGLWFRVHGGKFESNAKSYVRPFDMKYGGVHIGYDRKIENVDGGDFYAGIMFGYSKGDLDYMNSGSGRIDSKLVGVYGTYIKPNGFYIDTVLKYQWMKNDFETLESAYSVVKGNDVNTGGFGASIEFGQRIRFDENKTGGWYMEPQAQLSYMRQDGGVFKTADEFNIGVEPFNSLLGRLGVLVGYETERSNFYAKVSRVKEFDGDLKIIAGTQTINESFAGSWWVYGIGYTSRLNDKNSIYIDLERTSGGTFRQPWALKAGWRRDI